MQTIFYDSGAIAVLNCVCMPAFNSPCDQKTNYIQPRLVTGFVRKDVDSVNVHNNVV